MLHSLPALLQELEQKLVAGENPLPLLSGIRWPEVIDWPRTPAEAERLRHKLDDLRFLVNGLQAPLRATLARVTPSATYSGREYPRRSPAVSLRYGSCI